MTKKKSFSSFLNALLAPLSSVQLTAVLLTLIIPAAILGTLIPQGRTVPEYVGQYGWTLFRILDHLQLPNVFRSFWFIGLVLALCLNLLCCTIVNILEGKRQWGFLVVHGSLILLIVGGLLTMATRIRGEIKVFEGETVDTFQLGDKKIPLGYQIRLTDFELQTYGEGGEKLMVTDPVTGKVQKFFFRTDVWTDIPGTALKYRVEQKLADFRFDQASKQFFSASEEPNNPAIHVHIQGPQIDYGEWLFAKFEDFHGHDKEKPLELKYVWERTVPKAFISHVEVLKNGQKLFERDIKVNQPLRYGGWSIYQSTYDGPEGKWSGLDVVKDSGVWVVWLGILGLMVGLSYNIYIRPFLAKEKTKRAA